MRRVLPVVAVAVAASWSRRIWSFGGPPGTNQLLLNPVVGYHFGDGWPVGWSRTVTVGGGPGKVARLGRRR